MNFKTPNKESKLKPDKDNKIFKCVISFFTLSILMLSSSLSWAAVVSNYDSSGRPVYLEQEIVKNPDRFLARLQLEFKRGNLAAVGQYASQLRKALPDNAEVAGLYSIYHLSKNDLFLAKDELFKAKKLQKNNFYTLIAEAMLLQRQKKYSQAEKAIKSAIAIEKTHPYPWNVLGRIYSDQGNHQKALASYQKAVDMSELFHPGHLNLGATNYLLNNLDAAVASFTNAIRLNPNSGSAHLGIALTYEATNRPLLALTHFKKSIELNPANTPALENIAIGKIDHGCGYITENRCTW